MTTWDELGIDISQLRTPRGKVFCPKCHSSRKREHQREKELFVDVERGGYYCHNNGCEWNRKGLYLDAKRTDPFAPRFERPTRPDAISLTATGRAWLDARSIDPDVAAGLGVWDDGKAIAFPYTRNGDLIHVKYRALDSKRWWSSANTEPVFYNLDALHADPIIICEGELDVLALATAGIAAISVPNGAPDEGQDAGKKLDCLASGRDALAAAAKVVIATDNDAPGRQLASELVRRIGPEKCWRVQWPDGTKDANECLENYGPEVLRRLVNEAKPEPYKGLLYAHNLIEDVWDSRLLPMRRGVSTGIASLDELYRPDIGHLTVWSGTPSSGKSAFLSFVMHNIARGEGWKFVIFTPETYPPSEFYREMVQIRTGTPIGKLEREAFREAMDWIDRHFILQAPPKPTLPEILDHAKVAVQRHGVNGVVIDPFTNVSLGGGDRNRKEVIDDHLMLLREFGSTRGCYMAVAAHPTKPMKNRDGNIEPIGPYDINGTAGWFNMSDEMVMLHRTDRNNPDAPVEIKVWKMRSRYHGKTGLTKVRFDLATGRYEDLGPPF